ncbi:hypothetical protein HAX54_003286 [Datura stramonium]|uniref:G-patch domain-containing protein n=1 Tax=Datura stramonium TaxID=4076 RepID=A0ABS8T6E3_DATST|nr:hypothetical protein [Datura stramonium]
MGSDEGGVSAGLGMSTSYAPMSSSTSIPIDSSNVGFKLLKKHGWREGTGLGIAEQGRLEPVPAYIKKNKRGLGAEKPKKVAVHPKSPGHSSDRNALKDEDKESHKAMNQPKMGLALTKALSFTRVMAICFSILIRVELA